MGRYSHQGHPETAHNDRKNKFIAFVASYNETVHVSLSGLKKMLPYLEYKNVHQANDNLYLPYKEEKFSTVAAELRVAVK